MTNDAYCDELTRELPVELRIWLSNATRGLGRIGITRVVEDIGAHYREAYRAAVDEGLDAERASDEALASLGRTQKARRGFRRTYLTENEEGYLKGCYGSDDSLKNYSVLAHLVCFFILLILFAPRLWQGNFDGMLFPTILIVILNFDPAYYVLSHRFFLRGQIRRVLCARAVLMPLLFVFLLIGEPWDLFSTTLFSLIVGVSLLLASPARKLPKELNQEDMCLLLKDAVH